MAGRIFWMVSSVLAIACNSSLADVTLNKSQETLEYPNPTPELSQAEVVQAEADLRSMKENAESDFEAYETLRQFMQMMRGREGKEQISQVLWNMINEQRENFSLPIDINAALSIEEATERGRYVGQILAADLNGDWAITIKELRSALQMRSLNGAAEAFILSDVDGDGILSTDEIKSAASSMAKSNSGRRGDSRKMVVLFDFDRDGILTQEEFDRGVNAVVSMPQERFKF